MRVISFNEKKQTLSDFYSCIIDRCESENTITDELMRALVELNNPQIEYDFFRIWLDLFLESLVNPSTKNFIKAKITSFICDKVEWCTWLDDNKERLEAFQEFMVNVVRMNKKLAPVMWKFVFKYIDLAFTNVFKEHNKEIDTSKEANTSKQLKNFENISYLLADYEFSNYKDLKSFIDTSLIRNLDNELTTSKDQYIVIKGEIKTCVQALFERLPFYSSKSDIYYGYREKAKIRKGFFIDTNNAKDFRLFKHIDFNDALDEYVINRLCDCNSALTGVLKLNARIVDFMSELVNKCCDAGFDEVKAGFVGYLDQNNIVYLPNYKVILTNLFVLVKRTAGIQ